MSDNTKIEWADATVNAVNGCSVISPGCANCYAMRLAGTRLQHHPSRAGLTQASKAGPVWTGEVRLNETALLEPLRWRRPRRIFWNAHGDLFHDAVPDEWIDRVFAVCALTPQHTHMILTKRSARMQGYMANVLGDPVRRTTIYAHASRMLGDSDPKRREVPPRFPLPNLWLGVSVEDQTRADERIPDLLDTPAAVRFISAEPLLGPVDLGRWLATARVTCKVCNSPFWLHDADPCQHAVEGAWTLACPSCGDCRCKPGWTPADAREVHMEPPADWIERKVGRFDRVHPSIPMKPGLDWVIVGGESGPSARPMHPDWARSLRDQCAAAGVAFHFKQIGEWGWIDREQHHREYAAACNGERQWPGDRLLDADGTLLPGTSMDIGSRQHVRRVGKKAAGRLLDGVEHNGLPA